MKGITKLFSFVILSVLIWAGFAFAGQKVFFYHTDPAGTPLVMTDEKRNVVWRAEYKPFGEEFEVTPEPENNKMFVGKEMDKETGLYYFGARYMEPMIGRFVSPDPVGAVDQKTGKINQKNLSNPQRLNYYAYALNNPYKYVDSDGRWPEEVHNRIIQATFSEGKYKLPPHLRRAIEMGSAHVDKDQSVEGSYKHAMRTPGQSPQEAERLMNNFIDQKVNEYKNVLSQDRTGAAYFALGEAMHPLMDSTSPSHEGFKVWNLSDAPRHLLGETERVFNSNPEYLRGSTDLLRRFYDKINQQ